MLDSAGRTG